jgi:hypothetical protein
MFPDQWINTSEDPNFSIFMSRWPTHYTYWIHADFPKVFVCRAILNSAG